MGAFKSAGGEYGGMDMIGVILAGGLARRMGGQDKAFIDLEGRYLLDYAIERLARQVDSLAINSNSDPALFSTYNLPIIPDADDSRAGPLAGVLAGLTHAQGQGAEHIVTIAVDTPFFPLDLVLRLQQASQDQAVPLACAQTNDRTHPVFGLWPVSLHEDLALALAEGTRKVDRWTGKHGCAVAAFSVDAMDPFFNVNTPDDLERASAHLRGAA